MNDDNWHLYSAEAQQALAEACHEALHHDPKDPDEAYDCRKWDWRLAGALLDQWLKRGWLPAPAPEACAQCGQGPSEQIHQAWLRQIPGGWEPSLPEQHPFALPAKPETES